MNLHIIAVKTAMQGDCSLFHQLISRSLHGMCGSTTLSTTSLVAAMIPARHLAASSVLQALSIAVCLCKDLSAERLHLMPLPGRGKARCFLYSDLQWDKLESARIFFNEFTTILLFSQCDTDLTKYCTYIHSGHERNNAHIIILYIHGGH